MEARVSAKPEIDSSRHLEVVRSPQETEGLLIDKPLEVFHISGKVEVPGALDAIIYRGSMPVVINSKFANLTAPGFGGIFGAYDRYTDALASDQGIFAISYSPARLNTSVTDPQRVHADTLAAIADDLTKNEQLADAPNYEQIDLSKITIDGHSMGGPAIARYALENSNDIALLNFICSVGFDASSNPIRYLVRMLPCTTREIAPAFVNGDFKDFKDLSTLIRISRHLFSNIVQTSGEVVTCHTADLRKDVSRLGELGVKLSSLWGEQDNLVPANPSAEISQVLMHDSITVKDFDHFGPQKKPKETAEYIAGFHRKLIPHSFI